MGLAPMAVGRTRPANAWSDGICQCFSNCWPSCYCTMFCCGGNYLLAQISAKQGYKPFNHVFYFFMIIWILTIILLLALGGDSRVFYLPILTTCFYTIMLRLHIVQKDNIRDCASDPNCNMCGECCQSFWCTSCSICQMARHTFGYAKVFDGDADPERKSGWINV
jgi:Cys-rich protein (TIGR01571 family)